MAFFIALYSALIGMVVAVAQNTGAEIPAENFIVAEAIFIVITFLCIKWGEDIIIAEEKAEKEKLRGKKDDNGNNTHNLRSNDDSKRSVLCSAGHTSKSAKGKTNQAGNTKAKGSTKRRTKTGGVSGNNGIR